MTTPTILPREEIEAIAYRADKCGPLIEALRDTTDFPAKAGELFAYAKIQSFDIPALLSHIAALEARAAEMQWRPIESAPKDVPFLAYWVRRYSDGTRYEAAQPYIVACWRKMNDSYVLFPLHLKKDPPTHWMHLPAPPSEPTP